MLFSLLNSSDIKMVPQYWSYGSAGVPAVPATIFMSGLSMAMVEYGVFQDFTTRLVKMLVLYVAGYYVFT